MTSTRNRCWSKSRSSQSRRPTRKSSAWRRFTPMPLHSKCRRSTRRQASVSRTFRRVRDRSIGIAVAPIAGPYGVRAVATDALISGNGFGSLRRSLKSSTTDRSRGRHPRLLPLKRACWSDTNHGGLAPNRPHTSHGSETSLHAYVGEQLLAGGALHSGNTSWKR
jgi:hypothetical protein